jgi:hypothetical protein
MLFAIYKNGIHLGNEKGKDIDEAINKYLIASSFENSTNDLAFKALYSGKIAIKNIHYS